MRLVQRLAIVRVSTPAHFITASEPHLREPIRIGQRLPRHANNISLAQSQNLFRLLKRRDSACGHNGGRKSGLIDFTLDRRNERDRASKWTSSIRKNSGHALVAALAS